MRFVVFDSWRGICAVLVVLFHFDGLTHFYDLSFVRHSWLFVDFFFVLSGFVITLADEKRLVQAPDSINFMVRRFGRLWPLHACMLLVLIGNEMLKYAMVHAGKLDANFAPFSATTSPYAILSNLFMVQSLGVHDQLTWNVPSWSISVEFATYAIYAAFCLATVAFSKLSREITLGVVAALCAAVVCRFSPEYMKADYDFGIFRCVFGFFVGSLTFSLCQRGWKLAPALEIPAVMLAVYFVCVAGDSAVSMVAPIVFAVTLLAFASQQGLVSRLLQTKPFVLLGKWSYSIYMVHWVVFVMLAQGTTLAEKLLHRTFHVMHQAPVFDVPETRVALIGNQGWMDLEAFAVLTLVILISSITYRFIEEPGRKFFGRLAKKMSQPKEAFSAPPITSH
jgi:hypothetical protein